MQSVILKSNNWAGDFGCAFCGEQFAPGVPFSPFMEFEGSGWELVCFDCCGEGWAATVRAMCDLAYAQFSGRDTSPIVAAIHAAFDRPIAYDFGRGGDC